MATIDFDEGAGSALERAYMTPDVVAQREIVLEALNPKTGEHVLDVGPGPGLLLREIAEKVGASGRVVGADLSEPMLELARRRCGDLGWVELEVADAAALPFPEASFDAIVSTQVYEYVPDIPAAMAQLFEITRPGGRVAILDTDYDSLVMQVEDEKRHARILEAWDDHFVHRDLPRKLGPWMREAGFDLRTTEAIPIVNTRFSEDEFSAHLVPMMATFAAGTGRVTEDDAQGWLTELKGLASQGRYFYSLNRYLIIADKAAA